MKIYKISQNNKNNEYDTYDSAIVVANDEYEAKKIHPDGSTKWKDSIGWVVRLDDKKPSETDTWVNPDDVIVEFIGNAHKGIKETGVIVASFNTG